MSDMQVKKFEPVPAGTYLVRVKSVKEVPADGNNVKDPFNSWTLEIQEEGDLFGQTLTFAGGITFSPNTKTFRFLVATGVLDPTTEDAPLSTEDFLDTYLYVTVKVEPNTKGRPGFRNVITETKSVAEVEELANKVVQKRTAAPVQHGVPAPAQRPASAPGTRPASAPGTRPASAPGTRPATTPGTPSGVHRVGTMSPKRGTAPAPAPEPEPTDPGGEPNDFPE